jgi:hypothetical protein
VRQKIRRAPVGVKLVALPKDRGGVHVRVVGGGEAWIDPRVVDEAVRRGQVERVKEES